MNVNFGVIALVLLGIVCLIYFIVKRNQKDEKALEKELNQPEITQESLDEDEELKT